MTLEEFKEKYGTDMVGLILDALMTRWSSGALPMMRDWDLVDQLKQDISKLLKGE